MLIKPFKIKKKKIQGNIEIYQIRDDDYANVEGISGTISDDKQN